MHLRIHLRLVRSLHGVDMITSSNRDIFRVDGHLCGGFTGHRVARIFGVFFDLRLNKRFCRQSCGWWFKTPSHPLWHHCNGDWSADVARAGSDCTVTETVNRRITLLWLLLLCTKMSTNRMQVIFLPWVLTATVAPTHFFTISVQLKQPWRQRVKSTASTTKYKKCEPCVLYFLRRDLSWPYTLYVE